MMAAKRRLVLYVLSFLSAFAILITAIVYFNQPEPPVALIETGRKVLSRAVSEGARFYATEELKKAEKLREELIAEWRYQNNQIVLKRDFTKLADLAEQAIQSAQDALDTTSRQKKKLDNSLKKLFSYVGDGLENFERQYYALPLPVNIKDKYLQARLFLSESSSALSRNELNLAYQRIGKASHLLEESESDARKFMVGYFAMFTEWKDWVDETIKWSKQNKDYAIIVDKLAHTCILYENGKEFKKFPMEMGVNWIGDKKQSGDKATPEGKYQVVRKLEKSQTLYHKALLINFPNRDDIKRFNDEVRNGRIARGAKIGGAIEIHGEGGNGVHWTDGCVALDNSDMDAIYQYVRIGTPVTIVGSTISLEEYFQQKK
jgi:hypothetical protein